MSRRAGLIAVLLCCAVPAYARIGPNPIPRAFEGSPGQPMLRTSTLARGTGTVEVATAPAPLPAGAVLLDSTWYDLQDLGGSLGSRIVVTPDGRVVVAYQRDFCELGGGCPPNLAAPQPFPNRAMGAAVRNGALWSVLGKVQDPRLRNCCVSDLLGGFGGLAVAPDGRIAMAQHMNEDGCDLRGDFYLQDTPSATTWQGYLSPIVSPSFLFPQIAANPNGSFTLLGETPKGGEYDEDNEIRVSYLAAAGASFVCPTGWQMGNWTAIAPAALFRDGKPAFPCIAASSNGRVGVAVGDFGGNVYLIESSNGSFAPGTVVTRKLTNYTDAQVTASDSTSTQFRPYVNCALAYSDTTPHVVWSELQARKSGATVAYYDHHSRIMHWDPVRGIEVVKQVAPGEADRYDDVDQGLSGPLAGFNTLSVDWPEVGFSADGRESYVAWLRFTDAEIDPTANAGLPGIVTGIGYGDVAISVTRTGEPWSPPQNVTQTPITDERFVSLAARNPGGRAHLVLLASATDQAGVVVIGDRGTSPGNILRRIAYLEPALLASNVAVPASIEAPRPRLSVTPNPARGAVRFVLGSAPATTTTIDVIGVDGRHVAQLTVAAGGAARWDGRDAAGHPAAAGVYFARVAGDPAARATRFTLLR